MKTHNNFNPKTEKISEIHLIKTHIPIPISVENFKDSDTYIFELNHTTVGYALIKNRDIDPIFIFILEKYRYNSYGSILFRKCLAILRDSNLDRLEFHIDLNNGLSSQQTCKILHKNNAKHLANVDGIAHYKIFFEQNTTEFSFIKLNWDMLPEAAALMIEVHQEMTNKECYVPTDLDCLYEKYNSNSMIIIGCFAPKNEFRLAALAIFEIPTAEECYANYTDIPYPLEHCIHTENIVVASAYRGQHLQKQLIIEGEKLVKESFPKRIHALSTVHPDNIASMKNLQYAGYQCVKHYDVFPDPVYNGASRNIMYKCISI
ncbi:MAG: GNAT family N-acetyltransferase [Lachnospiraceae bacterium]|nr:GNAT family N-acetyltransferase [Lachnospiraceae bacterium]